MPRPGVKRKAADTKLMEPASGAATVGMFYLSLGVGPLVLLFLFGSDLSQGVFVSLFVVLAMVATRVAMALLVLIPMAVLKEDASASLMTRAWRLSRAAFWPLAQIAVVAFAAAVGFVLLGVWATSHFDLPLWAEDYLVFPMINALHTGLIVLLSPAAYAVARHGSHGYGAAAAGADLQEMLKMAPLPEGSAAGSWFKRRG